MSLNTNQSSGTANQQAMATLQALYGPTTSTTTKEAKKSFIGTKTPDKQSDEVTAGGKITTHLIMMKRS